MDVAVHEGHQPGLKKCATKEKPPAAAAQATSNKPAHTFCGDAPAHPVRHVCITVQHALEGRWRVSLPGGSHRGPPAHLEDCRLNTVRHAHHNCCVAKGWVHAGHHRQKVLQQQCAHHQQHQHTPVLDRSLHASVAQGSQESCKQTQHRTMRQRSMEAHAVARWHMCAQSTSSSGLATQKYENRQRCMRWCLQPQASITLLAA